MGVQFENIQYILKFFIKILYIVCFCEWLGGSIPGKVTRRGVYEHPEEETENSVSFSLEKYLTSEKIFAIINSTIRRG